MTSYIDKIIQVLDFILSHFPESIKFPRYISTYETQNKQVEVLSKEEALGVFRYASFLDCKIRAYPPYVEYDGIHRQPPYLIFIDLDLSRFKSREVLDTALRNYQGEI